MSSRLALLAAGAVVALGCAQRENVVVHKHPNGLVLRMPSRYSDLPTVVEETATGFSVALSPDRPRRHLVSASVELRSGGRADRMDAKHRKIRGGDVQYTVTAGEGGSGGREYSFTGWESCGASTLTYRQDATADAPYAPDFDLVWAVIAGTTPPCGP